MEVPTTQTEKRDTNKEALNDVHLAIDQATTDYGGLDNDKLDRLLDELYASWTEEQRRYIDEQTGWKVGRKSSSSA